MITYFARTAVAVALMAAAFAGQAQSEFGLQDPLAEAPVFAGMGADESFEAELIRDQIISMVQADRVAAGMDADPELFDDPAGEL